MIVAADALFVHTITMFALSLLFLWIDAYSIYFILPFHFQFCVNTERFSFVKSTHKANIYAPTRTIQLEKSVIKRLTYRSLALGGRWKRFSITSIFSPIVRLALVYQSQVFSVALSGPIIQRLNRQMVLLDGSERCVICSMDSESNEKKRRAHFLLQLNEMHLATFQHQFKNHSLICSRQGKSTCTLHETNVGGFSLFCCLSLINLFFFWFGKISIANHTTICQTLPTRKYTSYLVCSM